MAVARSRPKSVRHRAVRVAALLCLAWALGPAAARAAGPAEATELLGLSLEELMQVEVVSASATARTLDDTAAAVYVLTADDIRRSGARDLPELLRQVPGLQVARINDHAWAVSARGFNGRFANLLLVLVDGRPVYDPLYGGVYWDAQNVPLWDVERVEVVRGPGGDLWGANAVNGVINVITRDAASTRGGYVAGGAGRDERAYAAARQGVSLGERGDLTLYGQGLDRNVRDWNESRGGFRWDRRLGTAHLSVNGEGYDGRAERQAYFASLSPAALVLDEDSERFDGAHLTATLRRGESRDGWWLQAYAARDRRYDGLHASHMRTEALELRRAHPVGRHGLTVGGGAREVADIYDGSLTVSLDPRHDRVFWYHVLVHDDIAVTDNLRLSLGAKVERTPYTGWEHQPSARALWRVTPRHAAWAAVSRAVRVPTRGYADASIVQEVLPGSPPTVVTVVGDPDAATTGVRAFEAGYRGRPADTLSLDLAAFYNRYDHVTTLENGTPFLETDPAAHTVLPLVLDTQARATAVGTEAVVTWQAARRLRLTATYAWLRLRARPDAGSDDLSDVRANDGSAPRQQAGLLVRADPVPGVALDGALRAVDGLPALGVPGYVDLTARVAWEPMAGLSVSLTGEHLLQTHHREFTVLGATDVVAEDVPRTVFARVTWAP